MPSVTETTDATVTWTSDEARSLAGVGHACLRFMYYRHGQLGTTVVVLWTPFDPRIGFGGEATDPGAVRGSGEYIETGAVINSGATDVDNTKVEYEIHFDETSAGWIEIGEKRYDLDEGTIFLVGFGEGKMYVKQVHREMSDFPTGENELKALATSDNEIREFFEGLRSRDETRTE